MNEPLKIFAVELYDRHHAPEHFHIVATDEEDAEKQARHKDGGTRQYADVNELSAQFNDYDITIVKKSKVPICPSCRTNELYTEPSWNALSRKGKNIMICSSCATAEAFEELLG